MKVTDIEILWDADCKIDRANLAHESIGVSSLHNKYFKIARAAKTKYRHALAYKEKVYKLLFDYYSGQLNSDTVLLQELSRPPQLKKLTKESIERNIDTDHLFISVKNDVAEHEEIVDYIGEIIKQINNRSFHIKNHIDYLRWSKGEG